MLTFIEFSTGVGGSCCLSMPFAGRSALLVYRQSMTPVLL
jgi:hypothetical protein